MSKLEVDTIAPQSGTTVTLGESGDTITVPSGATLDTSNSTVTLPDGSVSNAKLANSSITLNGNSVSLGGSASIASGMFRNIIINGDMSIAQRATSTSSITSTGYQTLDRFKTNISSLGTWTQSQSTDVPSGQGFATSLKMDCTTADASPSASDKLLIQQLIEGQNLQYLKKGTANAESLTLSFWVKSNKTGTYIANLYDGDNTRQISKSYTISSADTWEKKIITFAGDTSGAFNNDNGVSLYLQLYLGAGSNFTSGTLATSWESATNANAAVGQVNLADSTANEWYITGVQLEAGTTASDFEFLPYDVNFTRCQRYYQVLAPGGVKYIPIVQYQAGFRSLAQTFPTEMRTAPTFTVDTYNGFTSFNGSELTTNTIHAYEDISYSVASSLIVRGVRLDAEL